MKYQVRLSKQMRKLQIALMICVLIVGISSAAYGFLAPETGIWAVWKPARFVFAAAAMLIALLIAGNGYREISTRLIVYPGRKVIVHKGHSVKVYTFDELKKPKPVRENGRAEQSVEELPEDEDKYGLSMVLRQRNGKQIVKLSTSYKYVKRLEQDLIRYS
ncbi:MAG: hypothetical protein Q4B03_01840 [Lachnospiraceae bacterium]|nr:hypothetical protein [Lachnospiraceae bacterium]